MKYYTYISDAKVNMIWGQIPKKNRRKIAQELKVDLGVLKLSHKQDVENEESRYARLDAVIEYINSNEWSAPLDHDAPYISDTLFFKWGQLGHRLRESVTRSPILFGLDESKNHNSEVSLIMTGSPRHIVGSTLKPTFDDDHSNASSAPGFAWYLQNLYSTEFDEIDKETSVLAFESKPPPSPDSTVSTLPQELIKTLLDAKPNEDERPKPLPSGTSSYVQPDEWMNRLFRLKEDISCLPSQRLEFLAKRLSKFNSYWMVNDGEFYWVLRPIILASPIYVAVAE